jgi:hypothetical protein
MIEHRRVDAATERMLDDWGWWVRGRASTGYRCRSIEGRYRPERVPDADQAPRMVDEGVCLAVERTVCHPGFPACARVVLKGWYVQRASGPRIAALAGIPRDSFRHELFRAITMFANRMKKVVDIPARASTMPLNESDRP